MSRKKILINMILMIGLVLFGALCEAKLSNEIKVISSEVGRASYYSDRYQGKRTASGEVYDKSKLTAVHKDYPFGTMLKVTNLQNQHSVIVKVNDRAKLGANHVLDLSKQAAKELNFIRAGWATVKVEQISLSNA